MYICMCEIHPLHAMGIASFQCLSICVGFVLFLYFVVWFAGCIRFILLTYLHVFDKVYIFLCLCV